MGPNTGVNTDGVNPGLPFDVNTAAYTQRWATLFNCFCAVIPTGKI